MSVTHNKLTGITFKFRVNYLQILCAEMSHVCCVDLVYQWDVLYARCLKGDSVVMIIK